MKPLGFPEWSIPPISNGDVGGRRKQSSIYWILHFDNIFPLLVLFVPVIPHPSKPQSSAGFLSVFYA
jgi:hypothetical protein